MASSGEIPSWVKNSLPRDLVGDEGENTLLISDFGPLVVVLRDDQIDRIARRVVDLLKEQPLGWLQGGAWIDQHDIPGACPVRSPAGHLCTLPWGHDSCCSWDEKQWHSVPDWAAIARLVGGGR